MIFKKIMQSMWVLILVMMFSIRVDAQVECLGHWSDILTGIIQGQNFNATAIAANCRSAVEENAASGLGGGQASKNQFVVANAAIYLDNPTGDTPLWGPTVFTAAEKRNFWTSYFNLQRQTQYGFMSSEVLSPKYAPHVVGAVLQVLKTARANGHTDIEAAAVPWLKAYWALNALSATGGSIGNGKLVGSSTRDYLFPAGGNGSFSNGLTLAMTGARMGKSTEVVPNASTSTHTTQITNRHPTHFLAALGLNISPRKFTFNVLNTQGFWGGLYYAVDAAGINVPITPGPNQGIMGNSGSPGHYNDPNIHPSLFGLTSSEQDALRTIALALGPSASLSTALNTAVSLVRPFPPGARGGDSCEISFLRTSQGVSTWFGGDETQKQKVCNITGMSYVGATVDYATNYLTYLAPLATGSGGNMSPLLESYRTGNQICASWPAAANDLCMPVIGGQTAYHIYWENTGLSIIEGGGGPPVCNPQHEFDYEVVGIENVGHQTVMQCTAGTQSVALTLRNTGSRSWVPHNVSSGDIGQYKFGVRGEQGNHGLPDRHPFSSFARAPITETVDSCDTTTIIFPLNNVQNAAQSAHNIIAPDGGSVDDYLYQYIIDWGMVFERANAEDPLPQSEAFWFNDVSVIEYDRADVRMKLHDAALSFNGPGSPLFCGDSTPASITLTNNGALPYGTDDINAVSITSAQIVIDDPSGISNATDQSYWSSGLACGESSTYNFNFVPQGQSGQFMFGGHSIIQGATPDPFPTPPNISGTFSTTINVSCACQNNSHCGSGQVCEDGTCVVPPGQCPIPQTTLNDDTLIVQGPGTYLADVLANDSDSFGRVLIVSSVDTGCNQAASLGAYGEYIAVNGSLVTDDCDVNYSVETDDGVMLGSSVLEIFGGSPTCDTCPEIAQQPQSVQVEYGDSAQFTVAAVDPGNVDSYAWFKDADSNPVGDNNAILTIAAVSDLDVGEYYVVVSNVDGSVVSSRAALTIGERSQSPYSGSPVNIAPQGGTLFAAAYFDDGGNGQAYLDSNSEFPLPNANVPRTLEHVEMRPFANNFAVTGIVPGEWLEYTVEFAQEGLYTMAASVSAGAGQLEVGFYTADGELQQSLGNIQFAPSGGGEFRAVPLNNVIEIVSGSALRRVLRLSIVSGNFELANFVIGPQHFCNDERATFSGRPANSLGLTTAGNIVSIEAEHFDAGCGALTPEDSGAYYDIDGNHNRPADNDYRSDTAVDIVRAVQGSDEIYFIDHAAENEWLEYSLNAGGAPSTTRFINIDVNLRPALASDTAAFRVELYETQDNGGALLASSASIVASEHDLSSSIRALSSVQVNGGEDMVIRVRAVAAGYRLDKLQVLLKATAPAGAFQQTFVGSPAPVSDVWEHNHPSVSVYLTQGFSGPEPITVSAVTNPDRGSWSTHGENGFWRYNQTDPSDTGDVNFQYTVEFADGTVFDRAGLLHLQAGSDRPEAFNHVGGNAIQVVAGVATRILPSRLADRANNCGTDIAGLDGCRFHSCEPDNCLTVPALAIDEVRAFQYRLIGDGGFGSVSEWADAEVIGTDASDLPAPITQQDVVRIPQRLDQYDPNRGFEFPPGYILANDEYDGFICSGPDNSCPSSDMNSIFGGGAVLRPNGTDFAYLRDDPLSVPQEDIFYYCLTYQSGASSCSCGVANDCGTRIILYRLDAPVAVDDPVTGSYQIPYGGSIEIPTQDLVSNDISEGPAHIDSNDQILPGWLDQGLSTASVVELDNHHYLRVAARNDYVSPPGTSSIVEYLPRNYVYSYKPPQDALLPGDISFSVAAPVLQPVDDYAVDTGGIGAPQLRSLDDPEPYHVPFGGSLTIHWADLLSNDNLPLSSHKKLDVLYNGTAQVVVNEAAQTITYRAGFGFEGEDNFTYNVSTSYTNSTDSTACDLPPDANAGCHWHTSNAQAVVHLEVMPTEVVTHADSYRVDGSNLSIIIRAEQLLVNDLPAGSVAIESIAQPTLGTIQTLMEGVWELSMSQTEWLQLYQDGLMQLEYMAIRADTPGTVAQAGAINIYPDNSCDRSFMHDDFEAEVPLGWNLTVNPASAIDRHPTASLAPGGYGMRIAYQSGMRAFDPFAIAMSGVGATSHQNLNLSWLANLDGAVPGSEDEGTALTFAELADDQQAIVALRYNGTASTRKFQLQAYGSDGSVTAGDWIQFGQGLQHISMDWSAEHTPGMDDGSVTLWLNGWQAGRLQNIPSAEFRADRVKLGNISGTRSGELVPATMAIDDVRACVGLTPLIPDPPLVTDNQLLMDFILDN